MSVLATSPIFGFSCHQQLIFLIEYKLIDKERKVDEGEIATRKCLDKSRGVFGSFFVVSEIL